LRRAEADNRVFRIGNGTALRNVVIGTNDADGIHTYNVANLDNIYWMNVGEDGMTIKSSGTTTVSNIEGYDADDKFFRSMPRRR
jgi:pectate lyase C